MAFGSGRARRDVPRSTERTQAIPLHQRLESFDSIVFDRNRNRMIG
jgi:hypothetical protein